MERAEELMLALTDPREAYRRSAVDARISGSDGAGVVLFCLEEAIHALGAMLAAGQRGDRAARSKWLTRCMTAVTALEMGVDRDAPLADSLLQFYGAARVTLIEAVIAVDVDRLLAVRGDLIDVRVALAGAQESGIGKAAGSV